MKLKNIRTGKTITLKKKKPVRLDSRRIATKGRRSTA